jgi:hypothetical protein
MISSPKPNQMETKMNKFVIALATLATLSSAALAAQGNGDNDDSDSRYGVAVSVQDNTDVKAFEAIPAVKGQKVFVTKYGTTTDALEARRWDEKNGG